MPINKNGIVLDIENETKTNDKFRKVVFTGAKIQLVLMSIKPNQELGMETHTKSDQFFRVDQGAGVCVINGINHDIKDGSAFIIPMGAQHNIKAGEKGLKVYSIYAEPHHPDYTVNDTKEDADAMEKNIEKKADAINAVIESAFIDELEKISQSSCHGGMKIKSEGRGRGLATGRGNGPIGRMKKKR